MEFEVGEYVLLEDERVLKVYEIWYTEEKVKAYSCTGLDGKSIHYIYQDWIDNKVYDDFEDGTKPIAHSFNLQDLDFTDKEVR